MNSQAPVTQTEAGGPELREDQEEAQALAQLEAQCKETPTDRDFDPNSLIPDFLKEGGDPQFEGPESEDPRYSLDRHSGYKTTNYQLIKYQRGIIFHMFKQVGYSLLRHRDLVHVSLPVRIFEPRSYLQRMTDAWSYIDYLTYAAQSPDPVERMKNVVTFLIAGLHLTCLQAKPFNPILGETWQAQFSNGANVFLEQVTHHPPGSRWYVTGPHNEYQFHGWGIYSASFRGNAITGKQRGPHVVRFSDDGSEISWTCAPLHVTGMLFGERYTTYLDQYEFRCPQHNLFATVTFDKKNTGFFKSVGRFFSGKKKTPTRPADFFSGEIFRQACTPEGAPNTAAPKETLSRINGSWMAFIEFDGRRMWSVRDQHPTPCRAIENPLPSDCRFRADLSALTAGRLDEAQTAKETMENRQRHEAKLRKEHRKAMEKALKREAKQAKKAAQRASAQ